MDKIFTNKKVVIVAAKWNSLVTDEMVEGALKALQTSGLKQDHIVVHRCPGAFELPLAVKWALDHEKADAVVAIGAVIRGDTPHFDYVCDAVTRGIGDLMMQYSKPVAFGVLTTDTVKQARERSGLSKGNKGAEAAIAALDMMKLHVSMAGD